MLAVPGRQVEGAAVFRKGLLERGEQHRRGLSQARGRLDQQELPRGQALLDPGNELALARPRILEGKGEARAEAGPLLGPGLGLDLSQLEALHLPLHPQAKARIKGKF